MTWLVFGVSCLLVLAGAVAIVFGAPIIQLERGWAEVISGSVAVSSGGVVFALGVVLMRLETLREAVVESAPSGVGFAVRDVPLETLAALAETERLPAAPPAPPPPSAPAPIPEAPPTPIEATPPVTDEARELANDQVLWKRIRRPAEARTTIWPEPQPAPSPVPAETPVPEAAGASVEEPRVEPRMPAVAAPPPAEIAVPEPVKPADDTAQLGWLERSLFKPKPARQEPQLVSEPPGRSARVEPSLGSLIGEPTPERPEVEPAAAPAIAVHEPAPPAEHAADEGPTVIGRYQAGVASYIMYSDGTIEVETEGGQSHRFGSMDELKAFIANQDKADA